MNIDPCTCGSMPKLKKSPHYVCPDGFSRWIHCEECNRSLGQYMSDEMAVERWNDWISKDKPKRRKAKKV